MNIYENAAKAAVFSGTVHLCVLDFISLTAVTKYTLFTLCASVSLRVCLCVGGVCIFDSTDFPVARCLIKSVQLPCSHTQLECEVTKHLSGRPALGSKNMSCECQGHRSSNGHLMPCFILPLGHTRCYEDDKTDNVCRYWQRWPNWIFTIFMTHGVAQ